MWIKDMGKAFSSTYPKDNSGEFSSQLQKIIAKSHLETSKHNSWVNKFTAHQVRNICPSHVIDIGCGDGFYGKLCKYVLGADVTVTGVDANPKWVDHCRGLGEYSEVMHGCVIELLPKLQGELVIAGDVLEHLDDSDMKKVLRHLCLSFEHIIINSPLGFQPQEHEDTWEIHRCGLDRTTFEEYHVLEYNESSDMEHQMFNILIQGTYNANDE